MLIGINGKIGSGKTTAAKLIAEYFHKKEIPIYYRMWAKPLKETVEILSGIKMKHEGENCFTDGITDYTQEDKSTYVEHFNITVGKMLQKIGTDVFREHFDKETWIKFLYFGDYKNIEKIYNKRKFVYLISDTRFPNEADFIKNNNGILIKIIGKEFETDRDKMHESEIALDSYNKFDHIIDNTGSLEDLKNNIFNLKL